MGTTADKLQNILNAKNAIKEKFSIGDDVKFIDYADNINAGATDGTNAEYFKCHRVGPSYIAANAEIVASGAKENTANGIFNIMNGGSVGFERQWQNRETYSVLAYDITEDCWYIAPYLTSDVTKYIYISNYSPDPDPWKNSWHIANAEDLSESQKEKLDPPPTLRDFISEGFIASTNIDADTVCLLPFWHERDAAATGQEITCNGDIAYDGYKAIVSGEATIIGEGLFVTEFSIVFWGKIKSDGEIKVYLGTKGVDDVGMHIQPDMISMYHKNTTFGTVSGVSNTDEDLIPYVFNYKYGKQEIFKNGKKLKEVSYSDLQVRWEGFGIEIKKAEISRFMVFARPLTTSEINSLYTYDKVWSGQKAILGEDGMYFFVENIVELPYGNGLTPVVGGIYDTEAMISVDEMYRDIKSENSGTSSPSTSAADFYLCGYVNRNYFSYNTIVVSGMPTNLFVGSTFVNTDTWESAAVPEDIAARDPNGTYTLQNPADEYGYWWWKSENGCIIDKYDMGQPIIYPDENCKRTDKYVMVPMNEATYSSYDYPVPDDYTSYTWQLHDGSIVSGGSAVVPKPAEVEKYWEGYKLVANDEGKYDLAAETTKLTYADYMPVTGRIYDASATVEITNANLSEDALWACPHGMTSNENDDWVITASSVYTYNGIGYPWHAFDEDNGTKSQTDYVKSNWLQWQNKNRAVVVKRIVFYLYDQNDLNTVSYLQGSDDGITWTDIVRGQVGYPNTEKGEGTVEWVDGLTKVTRDFKGNAPCYKYWRLGRDSGSNFRLVIHKIEAFSQIPREVPK